MLTLISAGATDVGHVRERNEDSSFADRTKGLFIVADGMGGHQGGETASRMTVEHVASEMARCPRRRRLEWLVDSILGAHRKVMASADSDPKLRGMGTTVVAAVFDGSSIGIAHVGDSRCYRFRHGALKQLTTDHTLLEEIRKEGQRITPAVKASSEHVLTRAIGHTRNTQPDATYQDVLPGDLYLLCSDGLAPEVSDRDIADVLSKARTMKGAAADLIERARWAGGRDNCTVIVVRVKA
jgi:PPM family protein phosphatase